MIKTNIKMRVTPEQSKKVREIVFANGRRWMDEYRYQKYIGLRITKHNYLHEITCEDAFTFWNATEEVDADLFIRTNGTCEEEPHAELKRKYDSGDYICVYKNSGFKPKTWTIAYTPQWYREDEYKLIHKRHKEVLERALEGGEVECGHTGSWISEEPDEFFQTYNEKYEYRIKQDQPKTCKTCTHDNDCSMQHAAKLSGNDDDFWCSVHNAKEVFDD